MVHRHGIMMMMMMRESLREPEPSPPSTSILQSHPHCSRQTPPSPGGEDSKTLTAANRAVGGLTRYHVNTANSRRDLLIPKNYLSLVGDILERLA